MTHRPPPEAGGLRRRDLAMIAGGLMATPVAAAAAQTPLSPGASLDDMAQGGLLRTGIHRVTRTMAIMGDIALEPGARIDIAAGCTLTIRGHFAAPVAPVFLGAGKVDLNQSRSTAAHPEWWGATSDDGAADCLPAFTACLAAHPVMLLRAADYYLSDSFVVERPFVRIWGAGYRGATGGQGTRLLVKSGAADVVRVGPARYPGAVNDFVQGVDMRWMELGRTAPVAPDAAGLRAQYLLHCHFEGLSARESSIGFAAKGVVRSYFQDCIAFRSLPGSTANAPYRGFVLGGSEGVGLAGANGSIFLIDCNTSIGGTPDVSDAVGLLLEGGFADSFIDRFEATGLQTGIRIDGQASRLGDAAIAGHSNLHIRTAIVDQCGRVGIDMRELSDHALIDMQDVYVAVAPGAQAAIAGRDAHGACSIVGGQLIGRSDVGRPGAVGLSLTDSSGLDVAGLKIADFAQPVRLKACRRIALGGQIHNPGRQSDEPAIAAEACANVRIYCAVSGRAGAFTHALAAVGEDAVGVSLDEQMIDPRALTGNARIFNSVSARSGPMQERRTRP